MPRPNLLIVGTQKSGTTWLHRSLEKSAAVFGSAKKELNFFNRRDHMAVEAEYLAHFPDTPGARYYMESTPHYFRLPRRGVNLPVRIAEYLDDPKLIVMFRNPVDRYESAYIHHMMKGRLPQSREITQRDTQFGLIELGEYARILRYWQKIHPGLGIHLYDDLQSDPVGLIARIMDWLGLDNDITEADLQFRTNDKAQKVKKTDLDRLPVLGADLRADLLAHYRDDILALQDMIDRDLSHWLQPKKA